MKFMSINTKKADSARERERERERVWQIPTWGLYFILLIAFLAAMTITSMIPRAAVVGNIQKSVPVFELEGYRHEVTGKLTTLDGYTDMLMFGMQAALDNTKPFRAALVNAYHGEGNAAGLAFLNAALDGEKFPDGYSRYWHGYQTFLRPLLVVADYSHIRVILHIVFYALLIAVIYLLCKKLNLLVAAMFLVSIALVGFWCVPFCLQYFPVWVIMLSAIIVILTRPVDINKFMFIIGALTCFFDLLTSPIITLCLPLTVWYMLNKKNVILPIIYWGIGYIGLWASKFILADAFFDAGVIDSVIMKIGNETGQTVISPLVMPMKVFEYMFGKAAIWVAGIMAIIWGFGRRQWGVIVIAMLPIIWFVVVPGHSIYHIFMTYRDLLGLIFPTLCLCVFIKPIDKFAKPIHK